MNLTELRLHAYAVGAIVEYDVVAFSAETSGQDPSMEIKSTDGLARFTDDQIVLEFGAGAMPEKQSVSPRIIPLRHILEVEYVAPTTFKTGSIRIVMREDQAKVNRAIDTYTFLINAGSKKVSDEFAEQLTGKVDGFEYSAPPASTEVAQTDRKLGFGEVALQTKNAHLFGMFKDFLLAQDSLSKWPRKWPVVECEARVETGAAVSARVTATRVVAGALTFGTGGALVGAIAKKDRTRVYLTVTVPGDVILEEVRGLDETKARAFANKVNLAAAAYRAHPVGQGAPGQSISTPPPPPPPPADIPAGWYPQGDVQRYWDGTDWTEHTAPLTPS